MSILLVLREEGEVAVRKTKYGLILIDQSDRFADLPDQMNENMQIIADRLDTMMEEIAELKRQVSQEAVKT